jgi:gas vesicle protein
MSKNRTGAFIGGIVLGSATAAIASLLLASRTGKQTRQLLKQSVEALPDLVDDLSDRVQVQTDRFSDAVQRNWGDTVTRFRQAVAAGVEAAQAYDRPAKDTSREDYTNTNGDRTHAASLDRT